MENAQPTIYQHIIYDYARGKKQRQVIRTKEYKPGYNELVIREVKGQPFATFAAGLNPLTGKFHMSVTSCNPNGYDVTPEGAEEQVFERDTFTKEEGREICVERLTWDEEELRKYIMHKMPLQARATFLKFYDRCRVFFKGVEPAFDYLAMMGIAHNTLLTPEDPDDPRDCSNCCGSALCGSEDVEEVVEVQQETADEDEGACAEGCDTCNGCADEDEEDEEDDDDEY